MVQVGTADEAWEFALDPAAFAEDAVALDLNDPAIAAQLMAELRASAWHSAERWRERHARGMELAGQIFVP